MKNEEPNVISNARYSIKETINLLGISRQTLYKWTMNGIIKVNYRMSHPFYLGKDILKVWRMTI